MKPEISSVILQNIKSKKRKFSSAKKALLGKVVADDELQLVRVREHINLILSMLRNEGVIDAVERTTPLNFLGGNVVCFVLSKENVSEVVNVLTDGDYIIVRDGGFLIDLGDIDAKCVRFGKIKDVDSYDWLNFSEKLLDFVYTTIYNVEKVNKLDFMGGN